MVTSIPARAAGLDGDHGRLVEDRRADILLLDPERLQVQHLMLAGALAAAPDIADRDSM
jgi:N-acetylglucosamine-6-phosphate deacetylase